MKLICVLFMKKKNARVFYFKFSDESDNWNLLIFEFQHFPKWLNVRRKKLQCLQQIERYKHSHTFSSFIHSRLWILLELKRSQYFSFISIYVYSSFSLIIFVHRAASYTIYMGQARTLEDIGLSMLALSSSSS